MQKLLLKNYNNTLCFLEEFKVLVYKKYYTKVINLNKYLLEYYATLAALQEEIVEQFRHFSKTNLKAIKLSKSLACLIKELRLLLNSLKCKICNFITISLDKLRIYYKEKH